MERTIYLTNINYKGINKSGHCRNRVEVELELTDDNCFSAIAYVWNENHSDTYMIGQCFDDLKEIHDKNDIKRNELAQKAQEIIKIKIDKVH